tara:strand:+ start:319 stop:633 length:315 start_codon:yes stop_codon:yes gene_type:complete
MSISGTINNTTGLNASIGSVSQVSGSVSSGNELVVTRVTVPGPRGPQGASGSSLNNITQSADVDATAVANGSILQYRSSDGKWVARNSFDTTAGVTFVLSGGSF